MCWLCLQNWGQKLCSVALRSNTVMHGQTGCLFPICKALIGRRPIFTKQFGLHEWHNSKAYKVTFQKGSVLMLAWVIALHCNSGVISHKLLNRETSHSEEKRNRPNELCKNCSSVAIVIPLLSELCISERMVQDFSKTLDTLLCASFSRGGNEFLTR